MSTDGRKHLIEMVTADIDPENALSPGEILVARFGEQLGAYLLWNETCFPMDDEIAADQARYLVRKANAGLAPTLNGWKREWSSLPGLGTEDGQVHQRVTIAAEPEAATSIDDRPRPAWRERVWLTSVRRTAPTRRIR